MSRHTVGKGIPSIRKVISGIIREVRKPVLKAYLASCNGNISDIASSTELVFTFPGYK